MLSIKKGFSLIELMVVITVLAILAAIAVPVYSHFVQRSYRADAVATLSNVAIDQESYYHRNGSYATSLEELGLSSESEQGYYTITLENVSNNSFDVKAEAQGSQADDTDCQTITLKIENGMSTRQPSKCWE